MTMTHQEKLAMASELIEEVAQALFLTNDPVARWCEWEGEYVQKGEVISIADVYRRAAKAAIDLMQERMQDWVQDRVRAETERCARIAENLQFPEGYQWSDSNIQKFKLGAITAAAAIRETPHAEG